MTYTSPIIDQVDREFIDVDFREVANNDPSLLGWYEPTADEVRESQRAFRRYGDIADVYPESEWPDRIKRMDEANAWSWRYAGYCFKQREGSCTHNALAYAQMNRFVKQFGTENLIPLSPMSSYRFNASGPNSGSSVPGSIKYAERIGQLPSSDYKPNLDRVKAGQFAHTHGETGNWSERFPDGWKETAAMFRPLEWFWCESVAEWVSALLNGHVCVGGRSGHCICHMGLAMDGRSLLSVYNQSWGLGWGFGLETILGKFTMWGADSTGAIRTMVSRGGYVLREVRTPSFMLR